MGRALAANIVQHGHPVVAHDTLGPDRAPDGVTHLPAVADVARQAGTVVLSLPDGGACDAVGRDIAAVPDRVTTHVVDTSTIGVEHAERLAAMLADAGVAYVDAPVSGGPAGVRARTLAVMYAGTDDACARVEPVLAALSDRRSRVGDRPGLAQAMKLANNFLSATALVATSEAIAFGCSLGLDIETMLHVLNGSSGQNTATSDKFPNHVVTERYASGFTNSLMTKDVHLYLRAAGDRGCPTPIGAVTASVWEGFAAAEPGADFTRIFPFVRDTA
jgi:3-hydroxyisobutyrate dehydrogenase-like beta-hydroxyacid dehydrogenase